MEIVEVPLDEIDDRGRVRTEYGNLTDIQVSVVEHGLYQPITIRLHPDGRSKFKYKLVAGGRRFEAFKGIEEKSTIPSIIRDNTDNLEAAEIEMLENFARKDLTWYERITCVHRMNEIMLKKGSKDPSSRKAAQWGLRDTSKLINRSYGEIQRQLRLYDICQQIPELQKIENEDKAVQMARRIIEKSEVNVIKTRQAEVLETSDEEIEQMTDDPVERERLKFVKNLTETGNSNYRVGDAFDGLREMIELKKQGVHPPIRLCEVDPPYAIDLLNQKKGEDKNREEYEEIARKKYPNFIDDLTKGLYEALPDDCHVVFWHGPEWYELVKVRLEMAGFQVDKIPCIWTKPAGQTANPDRYLGRAWEQFIYAWKGDPILANRGRTNVFNYGTVSPTDKRHPTQRPLHLMVDIISTFTFPKEIILSPFLGSGATLLAAYRTGNLAFGWDLSEKYKQSFMVELDNEIRNYHLSGSSEEIEEETESSS